MTDRPILFSGPMIVALLAGRKTQTRRILKPRKGLSLHELVTEGERTGEGYRCRRDQVQAPRFVVGDRLWVREAHYLTDNGHDEYAVYTADGTEAVGRHLQHIASQEQRHPSVDWSRHKKQRPSIHMPRWASRLTLLVQDVRVERLQDISEEDAIAEGNPHRKGSFTVIDERRGLTGISASARAAYSMLWDSINGDGAWDSNPWVAAYTFEVIKQNIDEVAA